MASSTSVSVIEAHGHLGHRVAADLAVQHAVGDVVGAFELACPVGVAGGEVAVDGKGELPLGAGRRFTPGADDLLAEFVIGGGVGGGGYKEKCEGGQTGAHGQFLQVGEFRCRRWPAKEPS